MIKSEFAPGSIGTSTRLERADLFPPESLTENVEKTSVAKSICLQRAVSFESFCSLHSMIVNV